MCSNSLKWPRGGHTRGPTWNKACLLPALTIVACEGNCVCTLNIYIEDSKEKGAEAICSFDCVVMGFGVVVRVTRRTPPAFILHHLSPHSRHPSEGLSITVL